MTKTVLILSCLLVLTLKLNASPKDGEYQESSVTVVYLDPWTGNLYRGVVFYEIRKDPIEGRNYINLTRYSINGLGSGKFDGIYNSPFEEDQEVGGREYKYWYPCGSGRIFFN
jgi:hypothetical protein